ncbi:hypothetical protein Pmani_012943 [Petrolisthes manimaculis]|uniref:Sulfotransferase n=1 Tax=Petrolisthes manimaculis TaxID=1843537 RepID=A0AAE1UCQ1_9EUCA|nr:hypothetical protein Pmani_012943 [Petrolisthes manimaculis]
MCSLLMGCRLAVVVVVVVVTLCGGGDRGRGWGAYGRFIELNVTVAVAEDVNVTEIFRAKEEDMARRGITHDAQLFGRADADGKVQELVWGSRVFPVYMETKMDWYNMTYSYINLDHTFWTVNRADFTNITINSFTNDTTLESVDVEVDWSPPPVPPHSDLSPATATLTSALHHAAINIDNTTVSIYPVDEGWMEIEEVTTGVFLQVVHPHSHRVTQTVTFPIDRPLVAEELVRTLRSLSNGSVALLASYHNTWKGLDASSRTALTSLGSHAAKYLTAHDSWVWAWQEGDLRDLGVVVLASARPQLLYRLVLAVVEQGGAGVVDRMVVSVDGPQQHETIKLLQLLGVPYRVHMPEGQGSPRISRHLRFALFTALKLLTVDKIIVLEEDLILAPDFMEYMRQTSVLLDRDPSLYAVSAYCHFAYVHSARDTTRLNRVHSFPSYGWMVKRNFLEETLPMWPPVFVAVDWDYWMDSELVRLEREVVIPEMPRTDHHGTTGVHTVDPKNTAGFSNKALSNGTHTRLDLAIVMKESYEEAMKEELKRAVPLHVKDPNNFTFPTQQGVVSAVCVKMSHSTDNAAFKHLTRCHRGGRTSFPTYVPTILILLAVTIMCSDRTTTSLASGHEVTHLEGEELARQEKEWEGYTEGLVRLTPGRWLFPSTFIQYADKYYHFKFQEKDVLLMTYPKCGTTWLQEIVWTMRNNPNLDNPMAKAPVNARVSFIEMDTLLKSKKMPDITPDHPLMKGFQMMCPGRDPADGVFLQMTECAPDPRTIKTHLSLSLLPQNLLDTSKVVYLARNPKDAIVSFYHHSRIFKNHNYTGTFDEFVQFFLDDDLIYGPYWLHLKTAWKQRNHPNLHFMFFEDLKNNNMEELNKLNNFLNTKLTEEQLKNISHYTSFSEMKARANLLGDGADMFFNLDIVNKDGGFFRKGEVGSWKGKYTTEQEHKIDQWIKKNLGDLDINFKYSN